MLETIRQFAEGQLADSGESDAARTAHAHYFARLEGDVLALWNGPRQREAYTWFDAELANLRTAFRWAADHADLDTAAAIAVCGAALGYWLRQHEPVGWAEELIGPAKAMEHPRLAQLYVMAAQCFIAGRVEEFLDYAEAGQAAIDSGRFDEVPDQFETWLSGGYLTAGEVQRCVDWCHNTIRRGPGRHSFVRASLVLALCASGTDDEAMAVSQQLLVDSDGADNPEVLSWMLFAYGMAHRDANPAAAYKAHRRGLKIAQDNGNRQIESHHAACLSRFANAQGDPGDILDYLTLAIRNYYDSGSFSFMSSALAILAVFFDRLGRSEPASTMSGFAADAFAHASISEIETTITHLREVLGVEAYEVFARAGENMTIAEAATYAFEQIDRARAELQ
jgi:hypothetical protein